jgi:hypothetical protein
MRRIKNMYVRKIKIGEDLKIIELTFWQDWLFGPKGIYVYE